MYELEGSRRRADQREVLRGGTFGRGEKGRHLQGGESTPEKERHGAGKVVGVRQSVLGAVGKHQERRIKDGGFEKFSKSYFISNLEKAKRNYEASVVREKLSCQRKYPSADAKNFVFDADLSKTGDLIRTFTKYRDKEGGLFEITG